MLSNASCGCLVTVESFKLQLKGSLSEGEIPLLCWYSTVSWPACAFYRFTFWKASEPQSAYPFAIYKSKRVQIWECIFEFVTCYDIQVINSKIHTHTKSMKYKVGYIYCNLNSFLRYHFPHESILILWLNKFHLVARSSFYSQLSEMQLFQWVRPFCIIFSTFLK